MGSPTRVRLAIRLVALLAVLVFTADCTRIRQGCEQYSANTCFATGSAKPAGLKFHMRG